MTTLEKINEISALIEMVEPDGSISANDGKSLLRAFTVIKEMLLEYYEGPWTDDELMHEFEKRMKT